MKNPTTLSEMLDLDLPGEWRLGADFNLRTVARTRKTEHDCIATSLSISFGLTPR
jgi:hypothetical protein